MNLELIEEQQRDLTVVVLCALSQPSSHGLRFLVQSTNIKYNKRTKLWIFVTSFFTSQSSI